MDEHTTAKESWLRWLLTGIVVLVIAGVVQVLMGFHLALNLPGRLEAGQQLWAENGSQNYELDMEMFIPLSLVGGRYIITVEDGQPVEAQFTPAWGSSVETLDDLEAIRDFTVEGLFARVDDSIQWDRVGMVYLSFWDRSVYRLEIDSALGYITRFNDSNCGRGLLSPQISECSWGFKINQVTLTE